MDKQQLFTFYYDYLYKQWLVDTYGEVFFFPDDFCVRHNKFKEYLHEQYSVSIHGTYVCFDLDDHENKFFNDAESAYTMYALGSSSETICVGLTLK